MTSSAQSSPTQLPTQISTGQRLLRVLNLAAFIGMVAVNALAVVLPLNGLTPGEVSAMYPSLFTPAGYVFSIWSLIYLTLAIFIVYQLLPGQQYNPRLARLGPLFIITCLLNAAWLFAWHYLQTLLSLPIMLGLLVSLILCYEKLGIGKRAVSRRERLAVWLPFSLYLGWITVATVANVSVFFLALGVRVNWFTPAWALLAIIAATLIGVTVLRRRGDWVYTLVLVWAFLGIAVRQWGTDVLLMIGALAAALYLANLLVRHRSQRPQGA